MIKKLTALCCACAVFAGCGARTEVLKERVLAKVDAMLGELEVKRKSVDLGMQNLRKARQELLKAKIGMQVTSEAMAAKAAAKERQVKDADESLRRLRDCLNSNSPVQIEGRTCDRSQLIETADRVLAMRNSLNEAATALARVRAVLDARVGELDTLLGRHDQKLVSLENKLVELDVTMDALKSLKGAASTVGTGGATFADNITGVSEEVERLCTQVETELRFENERWRGVVGGGAAGVDESLLTAIGDDKDTLAEIEEILKN